MHAELEVDTGTVLRTVELLVDLLTLTSFLPGKQLAHKSVSASRKV